MALLTSQIEEADAKKRWKVAAKKVARITKDVAELAERVAQDTEKAGAKVVHKALWKHECQQRGAVEGAKTRMHWDEYKKAQEQAQLVATRLTATAVAGATEVAENSCDSV